jgi:hypothetical protein
VWSLVRGSLRHSRRGVSTIIAEVMMVLIVILMSAIVFVWVVPTFQSSTVTDNSGAAYAEKFSTVWGNFATFAPRIPESVDNFNSPWTPNTPCTGSITSPNSGNIFVPSNSACVITATVGNVYVANGANLTVVGTTINGLLANYSASVTLRNANVVGWTGLSNVGVVSITGSTLNTSGNTNLCNFCDGPDSAMYEGGPGTFTFVNDTVNGQMESEVSSQAFVTGNTVNGRLEVESATFGQITNNEIEMLDVDQNGILVISGNTILGNDPYYPGEAIRYGLNRWCAAGNEVVVTGSFSGVCIGNIEIDVANTGSIPVNLVAAYMSNIPLAGPISWKLLSGGTVHNSLPITIPVGQSVNVTMQWTPPSPLTALPWNGLYFIFVSSHDNFVDGYLYFEHNPALTITSQSRPQNRICPPCY